MMSEMESHLVQDGEQRDREKVLPLTGSELLELQQLSQLSYWVQLQQRSITADDAAVQTTGRSTLPARWQLLGDHRLYDWQSRAIDAWVAAGYRGIIKVVTGAGKTMLALGVIERLQHGQQPDLRVAIIVPTLVLVDQWRDVLLSQGNLPPESIAVLGSHSQQGFAPEVRILIAVINSAAAKLPELVKQSGIGGQLLLVVDECHRAGAAERRRLFETTRAFSIGLSATPERDDRDADDLEFSDSEFSSERRVAGDDVLLTELGPIVYQMNYAEAVDKGILAPFVVEHYGLALSPRERNRYEKLSREITDLRRELERPSRKGLALLKWCRSASGQKDPKASRFLFLTNERRIFLYRAEQRLLAVRRIIEKAFDSYKNPRIIIFHESIDDVMIIFNSLRKLGFPVVAEHSEFPDRIRSESINLFRSGIAQIIVSAKSLIEGFNVPSADIGIVAAASGSVRQRVQTLGRLLRPDPLKTKRARLIVLYVKDTVDEMIYEKADWEVFIGAERNEYYTWRDPIDAEPESVGQPPRRPPIKDTAIDPESLAIGGEYPGLFEGAIYRVDTQGSVMDEMGNPQRPTSALQNILTTQMTSGGRFTVTPNRNFLLKAVRDNGDAKIIFMGVGPAPLFLPSEHRSGSHQSAELSEGDLYPYSVEGAKRFSVLQRDARLIAIKDRGAVRFVISPEHISDSRKADELRRIISHLRDVYQSGKQISKVFVTATGDVIYSYHGACYYAGKAPEGQSGFLFE
jgi:superfamily II DNA or RNA helicase